MSFTANHCRGDLEGDGLVWDKREGNGAVAEPSVEPTSSAPQPNPKQVLLLKLQLRQAPGMWVSETSRRGFLHTYF